MAAAGYYTWTAGEEPTVAQINSRIRDQTIAVCTTAQRLAISSPSEGQHVWDTDLNRLYVYVSSQWRQVPAAWVSATGSLPSNKLTGQLMYDTTLGVAYIYDGSVNQPVAASVLGGSHSNSLSGTNYIGIAGAISATETDVQFAMPYACTVDKLYGVLDATTGAAKTWTVTVRKNAGATSVSAAITNARSGSDTSNTATFAAGDLCAIQAVPTSAPAGTRLAWTFRIRPS